MCVSCLYPVSLPSAHSIYVSVVTDLYIYIFVLICDKYVCLMFTILCFFDHVIKINVTRISFNAEINVHAIAPQL